MHTLRASVFLALLAISLAYTDELIKAAKEFNITLPDGRSGYVRHGENANRAYWPFIVPIFQLAAGRQAHICGGSIIHPMFIVTAAHCFRKVINQGRGQPRIEIDDDRRGYKVHVGDYDIASLRDGAVQVAIDRILVHDQYTGKTNTDPYDIALIKLRSAIPFANFKGRVKPIPLPTATAVFDTGAFKCFGAGWGLTRTGPNRHKPNILQQFDATIMQPRGCLSYWGPRWMNTKVNMCMGNGSKSQCRGDSGGPAVCPVNNQFYLAGIMSYGSEDCEEKPGVLLKIPPFVPWINQQVQKYVNMRG